MTEHFEPPEILEACGLSAAGAPAIVRAAAQAVALAQQLEGDAGHVRIWPVCWYKGVGREKHKDILHPTIRGMKVRYQEALDAWIRLLASELEIPCDPYTSAVLCIPKEDWRKGHKVTTSMQLYAYDEEHPRGYWRTSKMQVPGDLSEAMRDWKMMCEPTIKGLRRLWA